MHNFLHPGRKNFTISVYCYINKQQLLLISQLSLCTTENEEYYFQYILLIVNFIFTMIGIFANTFGLVFFVKKQRKDITTILFMALCVVDLATVLTLGPIQMLLNVQAVNFYNFTSHQFIIFSVISALSNIEVE